MRTLTLQDAKARFSEVVDRASAGEPQLVTLHGKDAVVIVRASDYEALTRPRDSFVDFFARSPHRDVVLDVERAEDGARDVRP